LYGFGAAAHVIAQVCRWQGRAVFAFTRAGDQSDRFHIMDVIETQRCVVVVCIPARHMAQASTRTRISPAPGAGSGRSSKTSGAPRARSTIACI